MRSDTTIRPVILCGGSGTRLWPLSRQAQPKPLLTLGGRDALVIETAQRISGEGFATPWLICGETHGFLFAELFRQAGLTLDQVVLEPKGRNTAPAAAVAALTSLQEADAASDPLLLLLPSDHRIPDVAGFQSAMARATPAALSGWLVIFGIVPTRADTGYGYIELSHSGQSLCEPLPVARFVEKPVTALAESFLHSGRHFWNSGLFLFSARTLVLEMRRLAPDVLRAAEAALSKAVSVGGALRLDMAAYAEAPNISLDYAVMERTDRAAVLPVDFEWSDIGSWNALWEQSRKDDAGNVSIGDVVLDSTSGSYVHNASGPLTVAVGIKDTVVITTEDAVLVAARDRLDSIKALVDRLSAEGYSQTSVYPTVQRPWGSYTTLAQGPRFQVKTLTVKPGAALSLQYHHHRAEHWTVVQGEAEVTRGDERFRLQTNESIDIAVSQPHRLANPGTELLQVIEVQNGSYLGEDDIVRLEDVYGRV